MHPTDDLTTRGGLMVAEAAAAHFAAWKCAQVGDADGVKAALASIEAIRELSASDAALARAIDAVPARG